MWDYMIERVRTQKPLIHCITNYVTANDVANIVLAAGGSPVMAENRWEVKDIVNLSRALVLNLGTLQPGKLSVMVKAGKRASALEKPVILDPVGAGASSYRTRAAILLLKKVKCTVIRGNISEIKAVAEALDRKNFFEGIKNRQIRAGKGKGTDGRGTPGGNGYQPDQRIGTQGVDAAGEDSVWENGTQEAARFARELSKKTGAVIVMTGRVDVVASSSQVFIIRNGHRMMANISGAGCMLDGVIAAYCASNPGSYLHAAAAAVAAMGICGEKAYGKMQMMREGNISFRNYLIDFMSLMSDQLLKEDANVDIY